MTHSTCRIVVVLVLALWAGVRESEAQLSVGSLWIGQQPMDRFGAALDRVGDVNGDGVVDFIVGADGVDVTGNAAGSATVFSGFDGSVLYVHYGDNPLDNFGFSVAGCGDVNGDGIPDYAVGAPKADHGGLNAGRVTVYSGQDGSVLHQFDGLALENSGRSVSGAGDVNGDGFGDILVGAPWASMNGNASGTARVYSGFDGSILHTFTGNAQGWNLGHALATLGDINNDGFDDFALSAPFGGPAGKGLVRIISGLTGNVMYANTGGPMNFVFGSSLASAGDVNGDGVEDLVAGDPLASVGVYSSGSGIVRVISGANGAVLYAFGAQEAGMNLGQSVAGGDVDGDGYSDIIVGAMKADRNGVDSGVIRVYSGSNGTLLAEGNGNGSGHRMGYSVTFLGDVSGNGLADILGGTPYPTLSTGQVQLYTFGAAMQGLMGALAGDHFGVSLCPLGDVDQDGIPDLAVGAPHADLNGTDSGTVRVVSGGDGNTLLSVDGVSATELFGFSLAGLGDLDGDDAGDILVGAPGSDVGGMDAGQVFVVSSSTGAVIYSITGTVSRSYFGYSVTALEDQNGDGVEDFAVGAPGGLGVASRVHVYSGQNGQLLRVYQNAVNGEGFGFSVGDAGDVDGDGMHDLIVGAPVTNTAAAAFAGRATVFSGATGASLADFFGSTSGGGTGVSVCGVGDINGDGLDDVAVGSHSYGASGVYMGGRFEVFSVLNGNSLISVTGTNSGGKLGQSLCRAGDVNGDGVPDIVVGSPGAGTAGLVEVYSGSNGTVLISSPSPYFLGLYGFAVSNIGDLNGDGFADVMVGAPGALSGAGVVALLVSPTLPILTYDSDIAPTDLQLSWLPTNGDVFSMTGDISCYGASPSAMGAFGSSLAPAETETFGVALLIATDPVNLVDSGFFGFDGTGSILAAGVSRQIPYLVGFHVHMQVFEISPVIRASNGIRFRVEP